MFKPFRRSLGALGVLLLGVLPAVNPLDEGLSQAQAATAGSGVCAQTVDNNSQIQVDLHDGDCVLQFKRVGTTVWTVPDGVTSVQFLIVGGGGGGGSGWASEHGGGGGGAGGFLSGTTSLTSSTYSITVGAGGTGGYEQVGGSGANSSFAGQSAVGGGGGGAWKLDALDGGSGGGAGSFYEGQTPISYPGSETVGQGNAGGSVSVSAAPTFRYSQFAAGGGGAGGAGSPGTTTAEDVGSAGNGGLGVSSAISGSSAYYAAGGGGGGWTGGGSGGSSVGGNGATGNSYSAATAGTVNTGSGGGGGIGRGGANKSSGADGGSGIVIIRFALPPLIWIDASSDTGASTVLDASPNNYDATLQNSLAVTSGVFDFNNGPIQSDLTTGKHIKLQDTIPNTTDFSAGISVHVYADFGNTAQTWERLIDFGSGNPQDNILFARVGDTNDLTFQVYNGGFGSSSPACTASGVITSGMKLYSAVLDGNDCQIYIDGSPQIDGDGDGVAQMTGDGASFTALPVSANRTLNYIGQTNWTQDGTQDQYFDGSIGSVRVFNSVQLPRSLQDALTISSSDLVAGATATLSSSGGSGDGEVAYSVESGNCTVSGTTLTSTGSAGDICVIRGIKAATSTYFSSTDVVSVVTSSVAGEEILRFDATHAASYSGSGSTWVDESGEGNNSTISGAAWNSRTKAFEFDGTNDFADLASLTYSFSDGLAAHFVADFDSAENYETIFRFSSGTSSAGLTQGDGVVLVRVGTSNALRLGVFNDGDYWECTTGTVIEAGFHSYSLVVSSDGSCTYSVDNGSSASGTVTTAAGASYLSSIPDEILDNASVGSQSHANETRTNFFAGSIQSLILYNTDQEVPTCNPVETTFTGNGTVGENDVAYQVLEFTTVGDCSWTVPSGVTALDYLVLAGGGAGGANPDGTNRGGGGGGAGGLIENSLSGSLSASYQLTVGRGGVPTPSTSNGRGGNGADSVAFGSTAIGGGGGGQADVDGGNEDGADGGSGGGGGNHTGVGGAGTSGQGSSGGAGSGDHGYGGAGGGGGGAGGSGADGVGSPEPGGITPVGGAGGAALVSTITGSSVSFGGGGGGATGDANGTGGAGGVGGGSGSNGSSADATSGTSGLGGGGGGAHVGEAGSGGSGIVIVRYSLGPGAPAISSVSSGDGSIDVAFTAPSHTGGAAITDYEYSFDGSTWTSLGTATSGTETISALSNGTAYTVRLRAVNGNNGLSVTAGSATTPRGAQTLSWSPSNTSVDLPDGSVTLAPAASALGGVTIEYSVQTAGTPSCAIADNSTPTVTYSAVGTCVIRATAVAGGAYQSATTDVTLTVSKASQTITFASVSAKTYGDSAFSLTVSSTSGLTVTVTPADTSVCTVASTTVTIVSVGTCSLTASQSGNGSYDAASDVTRTFTISPKAITMTVAIADKTYDGSSAASVSGTPTLTGLVAGDSGYVAVDTGEITAAFANPDAGSAKAVTVTLGDDVLITGGSGDRSDRYTVTVSNSPTATISKASQSSLSITSASSMGYGQSIPIVAVGGSSSGALSYSKVSGPCTVSGSSATSTGAGSCEVTATRAADTNYNAVTSSNFTITISKANQSVNFTSTVPVSAVSGTTYTPTATSSSGLTVSFSITTGSGTVCSLSSGVVTFAQSGTCVITAAQSGDSDYNAASSVTQTIVAGKINQTITFPSISGKDFDDPAFAAGATVSSGRTVTFATSTGSVCAVNASTGVVSIKTVGDCTVTASSAGDASYAAASDVSRTFTISPVLAGKPSVTSVSFGDSSVTVAFLAPGFVGGDAIDGYQVVATSSGGSVTKPDCSTTSPCTITGLTNGDAYTLTVAAINAAGVGPASAASPSITPARVADAVSGLATTPGDEELAVTWTALTTSQLGGGTFTSYDVYLRVNGGLWPENPVAVTGSNNLDDRETNSYTFTGLTNGTAYDVKIVAITSVNSTALSSNTATALGVPATVPDAPTGLVVTSLSNTTALASWTAPADDGGDSISAYSVNLSCTFVNATDTFCTLSGLTAGARVTVTVGATNLMGTGSTVSYAITMPGGSSGSSGGSASGSATTSAAEVSRGAAPVVVPRRIIVPVQPTPAPSVLSGPVVAPGRGFDPNLGTRATIGGAPATVSKRPLGNQGLSVQAGAFELGVMLSTPSSTGGVSSENPSNSPELRVPTGESTKVAGAGLLPGSSLQVWLPGRSGADARELARIPVSEDGTFDSELSFTAERSEVPIPIGRQVLQVTGYDEDGNQTVVDMTINIAQGSPQPELNRAVGALPDLSKGQSLATSAGVPETVTIEVQPEQRSVAVLSGQWELSVEVPEGSGDVGEPESGGSITLVQSTVALVRGDGFQPDTRVDIWLFSDPTLLGSVVVSADGSFTGEVYLDARFAVAGEHTLQLQGVAEDGFIKAANLGVEVREPVELTPQSAAGLLWWVTGGFMLTLMVTVILVVTRRRRSA